MSGSQKILEEFDRFNEDIPWIRITPPSPIEGFEDWNLPIIRDFILSMSRARIKHHSFLALQVYPDGKVHM